MGGKEDDGDATVARAEIQVRSLKSDSEDIVESYKSLRIKVEGNKRNIIGITTEMEEVKKRIRQLLNKRVAAEGPDYDEYQINRRVSKTFEPIDASRRRSVQKRSISVDIAPSKEEPVAEEDSASNVSSVSLKVTVKPSGEADVEVSEE